jgi:DNA-binding beta-propeller fold protein YncE
MVRGRELSMAVYVTDFAGVVWGVDVRTGQTTMSVPIAGAPGGIAITPDGSRIYVLVSAPGSGTGQPPSSGTVQVIDLAQHKVVDTIPISTNGGGAIAIMPGGATAVVLDDKHLIGIDISVNPKSATYNSVVTDVGIFDPAGNLVDCDDLVISPVDNRVYATDEGSNFLWGDIPPKGNAIPSLTLASVTVGGGPTVVVAAAVAPDTDNTRLYVPSLQGWVTVVQTSSLTHATPNGTQIQFPVPTKAVHGIAIAPKAKLAYLADASGAVVIDTDPSHKKTYNTVLDTIPVGIFSAGVGPRHVTILADETAAFFTNQSGFLYKLDLPTNTIESPFPIGTVLGPMVIGQDPPSSGGGGIPNPVNAVGFPSVIVWVQPGQDGTVTVHTVPWWQYVHESLFHHRPHPPVWAKPRVVVAKDLGSLDKVLGEAVRQAIQAGASSSHSAKAVKKR